MDAYETALTDGPIPLWAQIAERLRRGIEEGFFKPGEHLPGEAELNKRFGVSRTTSRAALDYLEAEGLIKRMAGRGSIVQEPRIQRPLNRLSSFSDDMRARGLKPGYETRSIRLATANPAIAAELQIEPGSPILEIDRILFADGSPIATSMTYLVPAVMDKRGMPTKDELDSGSLYVWLKQHAGIELTGGNERIEGAIADPVTAQVLGLTEPSAVMICHRTSWTASGQLVERVVMHYRADRYSFQVRLVQP